SMQHCQPSLPEAFLSQTPTPVISISTRSTLGAALVTPTCSRAAPSSERGMLLPLPAIGLQLSADNRNDVGQDTPLCGQTRQGLLAANSENEGRWIWSGALRP